MPIQKVYQEAPIPKDEKKRLISLQTLAILDTPSEERFDRITKLALSLFNVPISTVTLVDSQREWFKSCQGLPQREGKRAISFCGHALLSEDLFIVPDTKKDPRFAQNPMVTGPPFIRFYAAFPLRSANGKKVGAFCIKDRRPRRFTKDKIVLLKNLAAWTELELNTHELSRAIEARQRVEIKVIQLNEILHLLHKSLKHDLLNNLTTIKGHIEMYLKNNDHKMLKSVLTAIDQGANSIKQMSELEAAVTTNTPLRQYDIKKVIKEISIYFPLIEFKIKGQGSVWADQAIISVIENIFRNAEIHGKTKRVDVTIKDNRDFVEIRVTDYGRGIPPRVQNKLFQEGFKYGATGHTGLGLYIIKKTIERYGGEVGIKSLRPKGTTFILKLPGAKVEN